MRNLSGRSMIVLAIVLPYSEATWWRHPLSVAPFYLDVMPPAGSHSFDVSPGHSAF